MKDPYVTDFVLVIAACIISAVVGSTITESGWVKDCRTTGVHRVGDKVYTCSLKGEAK